MKKRIIEYVLILAVIISAFNISDCYNVSTTFAAQKKSTQSYYIKKGKVYNKKNKVVKNKIVKIKSKKYYASKNGSLVKNKIFSYKGKKYFAQRKGALAKNMLFKYKGKLYYSQRDYTLARNKKITVKGKTYKADKNGVLTLIPKNSNTDKTTQSTTQTTTEKKTTQSDTTQQKTEDSTQQKTEDTSQQKTDETSQKKTEEDTSQQSTEELKIPDSGDPNVILKPQDFGAAGDGETDDYQAFRDLFEAASKASYVKDGVKHAAKIFVPSGRYIISHPIADSNLNLDFTNYEIMGTGRESTTIKFSCDLLIDDNSLFESITFRDIEFHGNNANTVMKIKDNGAKGSADKVEFISCSFRGNQSIIKCEDAKLSDIIFSYCKISGCGSADGNKCQMFILDSSYNINWRFFETDIESYYGDAFYYKKPASVIIVGGSYIPNRGNAFNFALTTNDTTNPATLLCVNNRFEIKQDPKNAANIATLFTTTSKYADTVNATFKTCDLGTTSGASPDTVIINGAINAVFDDCFGAVHFKTKGNFASDTVIKPHLKFIRCNDITVDYLVKEAKVTEAKTGMDTNNCRITFDNSYDFYLINGGYVKTKEGLDLCNQTVAITNWKWPTLSDGRTIEIPKAYGYVDYVEFTIPKTSFSGKQPITATLYNNSTQIGQSVTLDLNSGNTYKLPVRDYADNLKVVFNNKNSSSPNATISMKVVKY